MTQKEQLWEQYEDAVFAILMDAVAEQEGKRGLQLMEELEHDPSAQVPEEVQRKAEKTIRKAFAAKNRESMKHFTFKVAQRIAIAVFAAAVLAAGTFAAFPEVRANLYNLIIREYEDHTEFDYTEQFSDEYSSADFTIEPGWLPDGFKLSDEGETYTTVYKTFQDKEDNTVFISKGVLSGSPLSVDSEDATVTSTTIQSYKATVIEKEGWNCIVIPVTNKNEIIYMDSEGLSANTLEKIAENLPL